MNESKNVVFYPDQNLIEPDGMLERANKEFLQKELKIKFPNEDLQVTKVEYNQKGKYISPNKTPLTVIFGQKDIDGLPPFIEAIVTHKTGTVTENIIVWIPIQWNERFMGTAGGGMAVGGYSQITVPNNAARGMNLPKALFNHFACATSDGGQKETMYGFNEDGSINNDLIENWVYRSTYSMSVYGKAITEILTNRKIKYSYLHGGSGGGRQCMAVIQKNPELYDGIWASCPAINWNRFMLLTYYYFGVMNTNKNILTKNKLEFFMKKAQEYFGSSEAYYNTIKKSEYNPYESVGQKVNAFETITSLDAKVMDEMWKGPRINGESIGPAFRKGVQFWYDILPICSLYFLPFSKYPLESAMYRHYARLLLKDSKKVLKTITLDEFYSLYQMAISEYPEQLIDNPDLHKAKESGLKVFIDHGTDDPLIPVDSTISYYERVLKEFGNKEEVDSFLKLFVTPGDGHGNCNYHNCGLSEADGMSALMNWVEKGVEPNEIRTIQVDGKGNLIKESTIRPY